MINDQARSLLKLFPIGQKVTTAKLFMNQLNRWGNRVQFIEILIIRVLRFIISIYRTMIVIDKIAITIIEILILANLLIILRVVLIY